MQTFVENDLKVPVYQKNQSPDLTVCYCFNWTREKLLQAVITDPKPADQIKAHFQAGRCGCEVNNPQGTCCLGNVNAFVRDLKRCKQKAYTTHWGVIQLTGTVRQVLL